MAPLVYLCARPQQGAAAAEYESFRTAMRLDESGLERWDLVRDPLPADFATRWRGAVVGGSPFNVSEAGCFPSRIAPTILGSSKVNRDADHRPKQRGLCYICSKLHRTGATMHQACRVNACCG